jgi:hypothetical protein
VRYVVLDTDVASRIIKRQLDGLLAAKLTGIGWCVTFVTVGELWQWATMRSWGRRTREELEHWLAGVVVLDSDKVISQEGGGYPLMLGVGPSSASQRHLDRCVLPGPWLAARDLQPEGLRRLHRARGPNFCRSVAARLQRLQCQLGKRSRHGR